MARPAGNLSATPSQRRLAHLVAEIGFDERRRRRRSSSSSGGGVRLLLGSPVAVAGTSSLAGGLLSPSQVEAYVRDGFVVCSGLIPGPIVDAAVESMWCQMAGPPKPIEKDGWATKERAAYRPRRDDRSTWAGRWAGIVDGPAIVATFTPTLIEAARLLADAYESASPFPSVEHPIVAPAQSLAINIFPSSDPAVAATNWRPGPHTDGAGMQLTEPRACRIQHMTFLTGPRPGQHGGGGTVAWPGCSRRLEQIYMADKQVSGSLQLQSYSCDFTLSILCTFGVYA